MFTRARSWWRAAIRRTRFEREMDDELRFHLEKRIDHFIGQGVPRDEAARRARLEFGNPEAWQERCRESRGLGLADALRIDLRCATRSLRKNPLLTATIVGTLALGVGANTAMFAVLHAVLNPVSYPQSDRLVFVSGRTTLPDGRSRLSAWSYLKFRDLADAAKSFASMAAVGGMDVNLTVGSDAERVHGEMVSSAYFSTLGVQPILGSFLLSDDASAPATVVLSEALWRRRFAADPAIVGTAISLNRLPFVVTGVAPQSFTGETGPSELWLPLVQTPAVSPNPTRLRERAAHWLTVVARLRPEASVASADHEVRSAAIQMEQARALEKDGRPGQNGAVWDGVVVPLVTSKIDPTIRRTSTILVVAVGCVLLIACLNIASMLLGRVVVRRREVAIRLAIGASRGTLMRQFLVESLLLATCGGVLGLAVAAGGLQLMSDLGFQVTAAAQMPFVRGLDIESVRLGAPVVGYGMLVAGFAALVFGLVPALNAAGLDVTEALKGGRAGWLAGRQRAGAPTLRRGLLIAQVALAVILLANAGLMIRTFNRLLATGIGIDAGNVLTFGLDLPAAQYPPERAAQLLTGLTAAIRDLPGVRAASASGALPLQASERTSASVDGVRLPDEAAIIPAGDGYFEALRIPLLRGRLLNDLDGASSRRVAVVSETAARNIAGGGDVIGRRLTLGLNGWGEPNGAEIVGVVGDVKYRNLTAPFATNVYLSYTQRPPLRAFFVVRGDLDPASLVPSIRTLVSERDRGLPIYAVRRMTEITAAATAGTRSTSALLALVASMALVLASIGLYGTLAYSVSARTREIGVRVALGADPRRVVRLVGREMLTVGAAGLAVGLFGARLAGRALSGLLYEVQPTDLTTLVTVSVVLTIAISIAGYVPARRALRISPIAALREN